MLRKGLAVAVILLFIGVAFAPSINADVSKPVLDTDYLNKESDEDCGCDEETTEWGFPVTCMFLGFFYWFAYFLWVSGINSQLVFKIQSIGIELGCPWA